MINESTPILSLPITTLPLSPLVNDYLLSKQSLTECYESFDTPLEELLPSRIQQTQQYRSLLTKIFSQHTDTIPHSEAQKKSLELFSNKNAAVIVTGQQAAVLGGPFYTWSKIAHAIARAKYLTEKLRHHVVPVFWLEDNDHDAKEAGAAHWFDDNYDVQELYFSSKRESNTVISEMMYDDSIENFLQELMLEKKYPFTHQQVQSLLEFHRSGQSVAHSFHQLVQASFKDSGLLILRSSDVRTSGGYTKILSQEIEHPLASYNAVQKATEKVISIGYEQQVQTQKGQLFYHKGSKRYKVSHNSDTSFSFHSRTISKNDFQEFFRQESTNFSPSALLRLVSQDILLPSIEVIMGPGELAYAAQTKGLYDLYSITQPKFVFRNHCVALFESNIERILQKEHKPVEWLFTSMQQKEKELLTELEKENGVFEKFSTKKKQLAQELKEFYEEFVQHDPSMIGHYDSIQSKLQSLLTKSEKKVFASVKSKNTLRMDKIRFVSKLIHPKSRQQERLICSAYYHIIYGIKDIGKILVDEFEGKNERLFILTSLSPK